MFIGKNIEYYNEYEYSVNLSDLIIVPAYFLSNFIEKVQGPLHVKLVNTITNQACYVAIGGAHNLDKTDIYVPIWLLQFIGCTGDCDTPIRIEELASINSESNIDTDEELASIDSESDIDADNKIEPIPIPSRVVIKPLDQLVFETDVIECFEKALSLLHFLHEGMTLPIVIEEFGNYEFYAYIEKLEPGPVVRIKHVELDVEFIRLEDVIPQVIPQVEQNSIIDESDTEICAEEIIQPSIEERKKAIRESWLQKFNEKT